MVRSVLISQAFFAFVRQKSHRWIHFFGVAADAFSRFHRSDFSFRAIVDKKESPLDNLLSRGDFSSAAYSVLPSRVGELVVAFVVEGGDIFADNGRSKEIGEAAGTDAEVSLLDVVFAERFGHNGVEIYGFIDGFDATCGLKAHGAAGEFAIFANGSAHHQRRFWRGSNGNFTR